MSIWAKPLILHHNLVTYDLLMEIVLRLRRGKRGNARSGLSHFARLLAYLLVYKDPD